VEGYNTSGAETIKMAKNLKPIEKYTFLNMPVELCSSPKMPYALHGRKGILIVDDDPLVRKALHFLFDKIGYSPMVVVSLTDAYQLLGDGQIDLVVTDYRLAPEETGLDLLGYLQRKRPDLPVIVMSGSDEGGLAERAEQAGAYAFFRKPLELPEFLQSCQQALNESPSI